MAAFERGERFCERAIRFAGVVSLRGTQLKRYDISIDGAPVDEASYGRAMKMAEEVLPREAVAADRPGVGVMIRHTGRAVEYLVVCWWENQNELIVRVFVRAMNDGGKIGREWRDAAGEYSVCVWDFAVLWHERGAYVRHVMTPAAGPDLEAYLRDSLGEV